MSIDKAIEAKKRGNQFFSQGDYEQAAREFTDAISLDPNGHVYYSNRSACYLELHRFEDALADAQNCTRLAPSWPKGHSRLGNAFFRLQRFSEAVDSFQHALSLDPSNDDIKNSLSLATSSLQKQNLSFTNNKNDNNNTDPLNKMKSVFASLPQQIASDPSISHLLNDPSFMEKLKNIQSNPSSLFSTYLSDPQIMQVLSVIMKNPSFSASQPSPFSSPSSDPPFSKNDTKTDGKGDEKGGEKVDEKGGEKGDEAENKKELGNKKFKEKKFDEAISLYSEAIALNDKNILYLTNRATAKSMKNDFDGALKDCEKAIEIGRAIFAPFQHIAKAIEKKGDILKKKKAVAEALECYKESLLEHNEYRVRKKIKVIQEQVEEEQRRNYLDPEKALVHKERGNDFFKKSLWKEAVDEYSESIKRNPNDHKVYCNRAAAYSKLMAWEYALNDCNKSIEIEPNFAKAYLRKGKIQHFLKDLSGAIQTLNSGLDVEPNSSQLVEAKQETLMEAMRLSREGKITEEVKAKAMKDASIQKLLADPVVMETLENLKSNPMAGQMAMRNPEIMRKLEVLIAAGVVQIG